MLASWYTHLNESLHVTYHIHSIFCVDRFGSLPTAFCGFNSETIPSLLLSIQSESDTHSGGDQQPEEVDAIIRKCQERLLWVCSPEQILAHNQSGPWSREKFFEEQDHSDLVRVWIQRTFGAPF